MNGKIDIQNKRYSLEVEECIIPITSIIINEQKYKYILKCALKYASADKQIQNV